MSDLKKPSNCVGKPEKQKHGAPRIHNREQIAIDLVEWARKSDSINLCKFCALYNPPIIPSVLLRWCKEDDSLRLAYECAKSFLGFRREENLNKGALHVKAYDLNAHVYDMFLKAERDEQSSSENDSISLDDLLSLAKKKKLKQE